MKGNPLMAKFAPTSESVESLINSLNKKQKQDDAYTLIALYQKLSGLDPVVWYPGIIGFGTYHYKYESGHEGDAPLLSFAPRQSKISLYLDQDFPNRKELLQDLGKIKEGVGCVYVNKLADIDLDVLEEILRVSLEYINNKPKA